MSDQQTASRNTLVNVSLVLLGLIALFFVYSLVTRVFSPPADAYREENVGQLVGDIIQVEVRNGCGVSGLAGEMTQYLRKRGFDVVEVGDLTAFNQEYTVVYDRIGDLESAKKLAESIGVAEDRVIQDIRLDEYLDASVVIGKDYQELSPFKMEN